MQIKNLILTLMKILNSMTKILNWIGYVSLIGIVLITCADVFGRYCLNKPLLGGFELIELSTAVVGSFAMLYTTTQRMHISVDLFFIQFSRRTQVILESFGSLLGFGIWGIMAYQIYLLGIRLLRSGESTILLHIPLSPFQFILALGVALYSLTLLIQGLHTIFLKESVKEEGGLSI